MRKNSLEAVLEKIKSYLSNNASMSMLCGVYISHENSSHLQEELSIRH